MVFCLFSLNKINGRIAFCLSLTCFSLLTSIPGSRKRTEITLHGTKRKHHIDFLLSKDWGTVTGIDAVSLFPHLSRARLRTHPRYDPRSHHPSHTLPDGNKTEPGVKLCLPGIGKNGQSTIARAGSCLRVQERCLGRELWLSCGSESCCSASVLLQAFTVGFVNLTRSHSGPLHLRGPEAGGQRTHQSTQCPGSVTNYTVTAAGCTQRPRRPRAAPAPISSVHETNSPLRAETSKEAGRKLGAEACGKCSPA